MKRPFLLAAAGVALALGSGCKPMQTYFVDRARDFGEIFRVQAGIGFGLGVSAQAGPFGHVGLGGGVTSYEHGLGWNYGRGYAFGLGGVDLADVELYYPVTLIGDANGRSLGEGWHYVADSTGRRDIDADYHVCYGIFPGLFAYEPGKRHNIWTPKGLQTNLRGHIHSWDVEASVYAGFIAVRVGFSPGELVDFILGWFGVDIAKDDQATQAPPDDADEGG